MSRKLLTPLQIDSFFETIKSPEHFEKSVGQVYEFVKQQREANRRVVLVTSGGTIVPLERQMVRFLDNFSAGTRGAVSSEYYLIMTFELILGKGGS